MVDREHPPDLEAADRVIDRVAVQPGLRGEAAQPDERAVGAVDV